MVEGVFLFMEKGRAEPWTSGKSKKGRRGRKKGNIKIKLISTKMSSNAQSGKSHPKACLDFYVLFISVLLLYQFLLVRSRLQGVKVPLGGINTGWEQGWGGGDVYCVVYP